MKGMRLVLALLALSLGGCGDGSVQSPDFTSGLVGLKIDPASVPQATVALGDSVQFRALGTFSLPPGTSPSTNDTEERPVDAEWSVSPTTRATITGTGLASTLSQGNVLVSATVSGATAQAEFTIGAPVLRDIVIQPSSANIPLGGSQTFTALGIYSNSSSPQPLDVPATWTSGNTSVVTVTPATGTSTSATAIAQGSTTVTATVVSNGQTLTEVVPVTVVNAALTGILSVEPPTAAVVAGASTVFTAVGSFSDGSTATLPDSSINWTVTDDLDTGDVATLTNGADETPGVTATGNVAGIATVTATLKDSVASSTTNRSASAELTVSGTLCTQNLRASQGATVGTDISGLCIGCLVDDEVNIIDNDDTNFAGVLVPVGLLGAGVSVTATAADSVTFEPGKRAGFIIGRPGSELLSLEALSALDVTTLLDGQVVESSSALIPLRLTLLGQVIIGTQGAILSIPTTQPYDAVRLSFSSGLASALTRTNVFNACAVVEEEPAAMRSQTLMRAN